MNQVMYHWQSKEKDDKLTYYLQKEGKEGKEGDEGCCPTSTERQRIGGRGGDESQEKLLLEEKQQHEKKKEGCIGLSSFFLLPCVFFLVWMKHCVCAYMH